MDNRDTNRIACHEAGHALACYLAFGRYSDDPLCEISIAAGRQFKGQSGWADGFGMGIDRDEIEKEIMTLWGGAVAEKLILEGNARGMHEDLAAAKDCLEGKDWLGTFDQAGPEVAAYLEWMRIRTTNKFQKRPGWRDALDKVAAALLERETIPYAEAKKIIEDATSSQPNPDRDKIKERLRAEGKVMNDGQ